MRLCQTPPGKVLLGFKDPPAPSPGSWSLSEAGTDAGAHGELLPRQTPGTGEGRGGRGPPAAANRRGSCFGEIVTINPRAVILRVQGAEVGCKGLNIQPKIST